MEAAKRSDRGDRDLHVRLRRAFLGFLSATLGAHMSKTALLPLRLSSVDPRAHICKLVEVSSLRLQHRDFEVMRWVRLELLATPEPLAFYMVWAGPHLSTETCLHGLKRGRS